MGIDVFISYHTSSSSHITKAICNCLEANGIRCWYAPRDTVGSYANSIANAIDECKVFVVVLNREASFSEDVLNEMNLAFERVRAGENIAILPFHISSDEISNDAKYYLGRIHWIDAVTPPIDERIEELKQVVQARLGKVGGNIVEVSSQDTEEKSQNTLQTDVVKNERLGSSVKEILRKRKARKEKKENFLAIVKLSIGLLVLLATVVFGFYAWFADVNLSNVAYYSILVGSGFFGLFFLCLYIESGYKAKDVDWVGMISTSVICAIIIAMAISLVGIIGDFIIKLIGT